MFLNFYPDSEAIGKTVPKDQLAREGSCFAVKSAHGTKSCAYYFPRLYCVFVISRLTVEEMLIVPLGSSVPPENKSQLLETKYRT